VAADPAPAILGDLEGRGIEIGAFHSPLATGPRAKVRYVDAFPPEVSRRYFPEVTGAIVTPDVIAPAGRLPFGDASQDFVLASHLLEHVQDPLGVLKEWHRVLRPDGLLFLKLPDQRAEFDRARTRTQLSHLVLDHADAGSRRERDLGHYREWARCVNGLTDPGQVDFWAALLERAAYPIHFHCWIPEDLREILAHLRSAEGTRFSIVAEHSRDDLYEFTVVARAEK
jgi:SAM-dependent methyltransferase